MRKIDRTAFAAAHHQGLTRAALAQHFNITPSRVTVIRKELGLPLDPPARPATPSPLKLDRDHVKALIGQGLTNRKIAELIDCHESTVSRIRRELGISHPYRGRPMTETRLLAIWQMLFDGWSHKEIHDTEGAAPDVIRHYFPGTAWTPEQRNAHVVALRMLTPAHFNAPRLAAHRRRAA